MRQSFHSEPGHLSSVFPNGEKGAVAPVSALKLFRAGKKRRRGEAALADKENKEANNNFELPSIRLASNPCFSLPLGITELSGPAGVGKTQLALSLCADCVLEQRKAVFLQLGGSSRFLQIASRRIEQMLRSRMQGSAKDTNTKIHDLLNRVLVHWVCNSEELMKVLQTSLPRLLHQHPTVSVVVLDGIANLFRLVDEHQNAGKNPWHDRAVTFFQISNLCKKVSSTYGIPFVVLNECSSRIKANDHQTVLEPALGLAWAQCVNASFFCRRDKRISNATAKDQNDNGKQQPSEVCHRILQCLRAPHISTEDSLARFCIDRSGIVLV